MFFKHFACFSRFYRVAFQFQTFSRFFQQSGHPVPGILAAFHGLVTKFLPILNVSCWYYYLVTETDWSSCKYCKKKNGPEILRAIVELQIHQIRFIFSLCGLILVMGRFINFGIALFLQPLLKFAKFYLCKRFHTGNTWL